MGGHCDLKHGDGHLQAEGCMWCFVARPPGAREMHTDLARQWRDFCSSENSLYCERNENGFLNVPRWPCDNSLMSKMKQD
jgi:hypothetical protein